MRAFTLSISQISRLAMHATDPFPNHDQQPGHFEIDEQDHKQGREKNANWITSFEPQKAAYNSRSLSRAWGWRQCTIQVQCTVQGAWAATRQSRCRHHQPLQNSVPGTHQIAWTNVNGSPHLWATFVLPAIVLQNFVCCAPAHYLGANKIPPLSSRTLPWPRCSDLSWSHPTLLHIPALGGRPSGAND